MSGKDLKNGLKQCPSCKNTYKGTKTNKKFCSNICKEIGKQVRDAKIEATRLAKLNARFEGKQEGIDYIVCPVCLQKVKEISILHVKKHGFKTVQEFKDKFNLTSVKCQIQRDRMKGATNPGYNHGGELSPWSNKSGRTKEQIAVSKQKAKDNSWGKNPAQLAYWVTKCNGDVKEAKELHINNQTTFSKAICIEKYGKEQGLERWKARQEKWLKTLNDKSDEELADINKRKISTGYSISKVEKELFVILQNENIEIEDQFYLKDRNLNRGFTYDFRYKNKIIEYFGDFWHHNPNIYESKWQNPISKKTSKEKWDDDDIRINTAKQKGYDVLIIWEEEYNNNKKEAIEKCIQFLKE